MITLLDNSQDLDKCADEINGEVGQLLTPLTRMRLRDPTKPWAIDNGGFKRLLIPAFNSLLKREEHHKERCLFVAVPDIVGSAVRTLELFDYFAPTLVGWGLAFVCQDGQENHRVPWNRIKAVFIGGSSAWKCGPHVRHIIKVAQVMGIWIHVGRVNSPERFQYFSELGADSVDGTGLARYTHMRVAVSQRRRKMAFFEE